MTIEDLANSKGNFRRIVAYFANIFLKIDCICGDLIRVKPSCPYRPCDHRPHVCAWIALPPMPRLTGNHIERRAGTTSRPKSWSPLLSASKARRLGCLSGGRWRYNYWGGTLSGWQWHDPRRRCRSDSKEDQNWPRTHQVCCQEQDNSLSQRQASFFLALRHAVGDCAEYLNRCGAEYPD